MDEAMDAQTWTIVIGVVLGFFAVPATMLGYDLRRQRRQRAALHDHERNIETAGRTTRRR